MKTEKFTGPNKVITGLGTSVHREDWISDDGVLKCSLRKLLPGFQRSCELKLSYLQ